MADETDKTDSNGAPPAAPAAQPASTSITPEIQAMIDAAAKKAHDAAHAEARRIYEGKSPKAKQEKADPPPVSDAAAQLALRDAFDDATADMTLTPKQKRLMREALYAKSPSNVGEWVATYAADAGWSQEQSTTMTQSKPAPSGRPASDGGAPAGAAAERPSNVLTWTQEDVRRYYAANAPVPHDMHDVRNSSVHRQIQKMAKAALGSVRILVGPQRR